MRHTIFASAALLAASGFPAVANDRVPAGEVIAFDVMRDGRDLGTHVIRFEQAGGTMQVTSDIDLRVNIGPFTVFHYSHDAVETWRGGELVAFRSSTRKDGEDLTVSARRAGDRWQIEGTDYEGEALTASLPVSLALSSHWNGYDSAASAIFNTETGNAMEVEITDLGLETITVLGEPVEARHIRIEGSLTVDLWYGPDGEWLKCEFEARGEQVEYIRVAA